MHMPACVTPQLHLPPNMPEGAKKTANYYPLHLNLGTSESLPVAGPFMLLHMASHAHDWVK